MQINEGVLHLGPVAISRLIALRMITYIYFPGFWCMRSEKHSEDEGIVTIVQSKVQTAD